MMTRCTLYKKLEIVPGTYEDYKQLAHYHYRDNGPGQFTSIYALIYRRLPPCLPTRVRAAGAYRMLGRASKKSNLLPSVSVDTQYASRTTQDKTIGVIVYSTATLGQQLRNIATKNFFIGFDQRTQLALLNKYVRRISRVIIEPRFRGLGLAKHLVRETMLMMNFPIIEAVAVMGQINPFFEKAGMKAYTAPEKAQNIRLKEALGAVGIEQELWIDPVTVQEKIERLPRKPAKFIEAEFRLFLQSYADRRYSRPSLKRTTFVLNKLTARPVYYIWFNKGTGTGIGRGEQI
jgi:hypothetical protein